jgi:hypothetical protein
MYLASGGFAPPFCFLFSAFCFRLVVALVEPWGGFGVALGWLWGSIGVALGSQSVAYQVALMWL